MQPPTVPASEAERLDKLRSYQILDSAAEQAFDDLVHLAAHVCGTPISGVSLIDAERLWFKSVLGLPDRELPRERSFCGHTINGGDLLVVEDAAGDPRFADNPLVSSDPRIRFYAGAPLVTSDGHALGALCVFDRRPRTLTAEQRDALARLGRQCVQLLELRLANLQIAIRDELTGLANRRGFVLLAEQMLKHATRLRRPLLTMFIELDGHEDGDQALRDTAAILRGVFRDCDVPARLGGDEFVVCIPDAGEAAIAPIRERLEAAVRQHNARGAGPHKLAMSIGATCWEPSSPRPLGVLLAAADAAMYTAKQARRSASHNQVSASHAEPNS